MFFHDAPRYAVVLFLLCAAGLFSQSTNPARAADQPNFVLIFIDDMGWTDVGCFGTKFYETPHIDRLAAQGMRFTAGYTNAPNCAPTRACMISGQYGPRHGIYTVGTAARGKAANRKLIPTPNNRTLPLSKITVAEALKAGGYATGCFGKWHLGRGENMPTAQGFDEAVVRTGGGHLKYKYASSTSAAPQPGEYLADFLTREALSFIDRHKDGPFFLYLPHFAVHPPIQAKQKLIARYRDKPPAGGHSHPVYAAMIDSVDASVGRVMAKLDELRLAENTVVIFCSDNGGHANYTSNAPLRGSKGMLYEGGVRVPLIVRWPAKVKAGSRCDVPVMTTDFYPTFLDLAGIERPKNYPLDGESIAPLLTQSGSLKRKAIFWHFPAYLEAYNRRQGQWRTTPTAAMRQGDWKLHEFFEDGRLELYNLKDDLGEKHNLATKMPEKTQELHKAMLAWRKTINAPVPTKLNPKYRQP